MYKFTESNIVPPRITQKIHEIEENVSIFTCKWAFIVFLLVSVFPFGMLLLLFIFLA